MANDINDLVKFYEHLEDVVENETKIKDSLKVVTLFRVALELAAKDMGLVKASYLMARLQHVSLGASLGMEDDFNGILEELCTKKPTLN